ncbi:MAG: glycosyltransferase [candidate division Zixibacteria bacterium]|nr:glycosyltransferase [candidate division Zixibacteria bacterium]
MTNQTLINKNTSKTDELNCLVNRVSQLLSNGNTLEAYPILAKITESLPDDSNVRVVIGCAAITLNRIAEAETWFEAAKRVDPNNSDAYHNLALLKINSGEAKVAAKIYESALERGIGDASMLNDLGVVYLEMGDATTARKKFEESLRRDNTNSQARINLLESLMKDADLDRAYSLTKEWLKSTPDDARLRDLRKKLASARSISPSTTDSTSADISEEISTQRTVRQIDTENLNSLVAGIKIAFFATQDSFVRDIQSHFAENNEVRLIQGGNANQMQEALQWCDLAWFEWCDSLLIMATRHIPKLCPIICRLHSYEAFTNFPEQVDWSKVDKIIFVNESVKTLTQNRLPGELKKVVIPNSIDIEKFHIPNEKKYGKRIASIGYINYKKNPQLLLYVFKKIHDWDSEFELHIAGEGQDARIDLYMRDMAGKMKLPVRYHGWIEDMPKFMENMDFVISTSLFESFHLSIAEGMASGIIPLVHDWFGSENIYPDEFRFRDPDECLGLVQKFMKANRTELGRQCRYIIEEKFTLPKQLRIVEKEVAEIIDKSMSSDDKSVNLGLVSIIIPTFNGAKYLGEAISSALKQTYPHCEIIVVDDGSTDNSMDVLNQFGAKIKVVKHKQNRGVSAALNTGIKNSSGEYISWLSSDDAYHPDKVWEGIKVLANKPELGWLYSDFFYITSDSKITSQAKVKPLENDGFAEKMFEGNPIHGCSVLFRKSNLAKIGYFDEELGGKIGYGADGALWHKMGYHFRFGFIPKPLVYYRIHPDQVSNQADIPKAKIEYVKYMREYFEKEDCIISAVNTCSNGVETSSSAMGDIERLGMGVDPDFPEEKPGGKRILWIGAMDPCGNAAMNARAINRYTEHLCRVVTFRDSRGFDKDITLRRIGLSGQEEANDTLLPSEEERLRDLAERADVLVFSACTYSKMSLATTRSDDTDHLFWGQLDWREYTQRKDKECVAFFFGSTATRKNADWYWNYYHNEKKWKIMTGQIDLKRRWPDARHVPTWLDIDAPRYSRTIERIGDTEKTLVAQTPTDPVIKNSFELEQAVRRLMPEYSNLSLVIKSGLSYEQALALKRKAHIGLDQMQVNDGYYCMGSLENSALGLANMVHLDKDAIRMISESLGTDQLPWDIVSDEDQLKAAIKKYLDDPDALFEKRKETYDWMRTYWHPSRLVNQLINAILD